MANNRELSQFAASINVNDVNRSIGFTTSVGIGTTAPNARLHVFGDAIVSGNIGITTISFGTVGYQVSAIISPITTTSATTIDSFSTSAYRSSRVQVQITQGTDYQASDILIIHDGSTADVIEYGSIATNDYLGTFSGTVS